MLERSISCSKGYYIENDLIDFMSENFRFHDTQSTERSVPIQSTRVISNSKGLSEILRDIRSSTYQICRIEEKNSINHF